MNAYSKLYLDSAMNTLGYMLEYAVYDAGLTPEDAFDRFMMSGIAERYEKGDSTYVVGRSGVEIMEEAIVHTDKGWVFIEKQFRTERTPEFWAGWALAYVQWELGCTFRDILEAFPIKKVIEAYYPYHEMDISQFRDYVAEKMLSSRKMSRLKERREELGLSQSQLARKTEIPVRTIQQYEQRQKNINHAKIAYLTAFAKALMCKETDLTEFEFSKPDNMISDLKM